MNNDPLFSLGNVPVHLDDLLWLSGILLLFAIILFLFNRILLTYLQKKFEINKDKIRKGSLLFTLLLLLIYLDITFWVLDIEIDLFNRIEFALLIEASIILVTTYLLLWIASNIILYRVSITRELKKPGESSVLIPSQKAIRVLKWLLFSVALSILLQYIDWDHTLFSIKSPKEDGAPILFRLSSLITTVIIFLTAQLLIWVITQVLLFSYYKRKSFEEGIQYSINKLLEYIIYFFATIIALRYLGMDIGLLLGGAAALLVGIGLALQATFSDFFSGLVLLFERPIKVGDYVSFEGNPVEVQKIGLRASIVKNRDSINYIIPNSKLITQTVINWSHDEKSVRFQVVVGVAYGSDTRLVESILLEAADEHKDVLKRPKPKVVFSNFADSALEFKLNYYSTNIFNAEWVKSDIRFTIDEKFREKGVTIPFPQRDVWLKKDD